MPITTRIAQKRAAAKQRTTAYSSKDDIAVLEKIAQEKGYNLEKQKEPFFRRAMDVISRPLYASAGAAKAVVKGENVPKEAWKGITGQEKETYSDVLSELGVQNKWVKGGVGFGLDIALDPTSYLGGAAVKGAGKGAKFITSKAHKALEMVSPERARLLKEGVGKMKEGVEGLFSVYAGKPKGLVDRTYVQLNDMAKAKEDVIKSYAELGKHLTPAQLDEMGMTLIEHKKQLNKIKESLEGKYIGEFNKEFPSKSPIKDISDAEKRLGGRERFEKTISEKYSNTIGKYQDSINSFNKKIENLKKTREVKLVKKQELLEDIAGETIQKKTARLNERLESVLKDEVNLFTGDLQALVKTLKEQLIKDSPLGVVDELPEATADEFDDILQSVINPIRDELELDIQKLEQEVLGDIANIPGIKKGVDNNSKEAIAKMLQGKIISTQNEYNDLVFKIEDKISSQINKMRSDLANKLEQRTSEINSKIIKKQNESFKKQELAANLFGSRDEAKVALNAMRPQFKDKKVADVYENILKPKIAELGKKTGMPEEVLLADYYPFISKRRVAAGKAGTSVGLKVGNEGGLKLDKGIMEIEDIIKNPVEAYSRRDFEVTRNNMNREFLKQMVEDYGAKFDDPLEAAENGYVMMREKGIGGKELGYLPKKSADFLNNIMYPEYSGIDNFARGLGYDALTNTMKTALTAYFPAFHIRNAISGVVQNYQVIGAHALAPANIQTGLAIMKGSNAPLRFKNWQGTAKQLQDALVKKFRGSSSYIGDLGDMVQELAGNNFKMKPISNARKVGNFVEMNQKAMAVSAALRKGHTLDEALELAEKAGFDYNKLTNFERSVMKRLIPFYSFAKFNAKLQVNTLLRNPERILNQAKLADALSNALGSEVTEEDIKGLPDWALSGLGFKLKDGKYVSSLGLPIEEFAKRVNDPIMSTLSSLNPIVKYTLESRLGYDFFREQKIVDIDKVAPATGELLYKLQESGKLPEELANSINIDRYTSPYDNKVKYTMSPKALHLLRNLPTARLQGTLEKMFDKDMDKANKFMAFFTGGKIYDIDTETQAFFKERDLVEDMRNYLMDRGVGNLFENFYIKKEELDK